MDNDDLIHIAYADDHTAVRKGIIASLENMGGICIDIQAADGLDMLKQLNSVSKLPDICMLDINMPVMDGFVLIDEIRQRWPQMPVLFLTLYNNESFIIRTIQKGGNGYLLKNCEPEEIKKALQTIFHTGYYYSKVADINKFNQVERKLLRPLYLSEQETQFIRLCTSELSYKEIAVQMGLSLSALGSCRDRVFKKLDVNKRSAVALYAVQTGIVPV